MEEVGAGSERCGPRRRALPAVQRPGPGPAAAGTASVFAAGSAAGLDADVALAAVAETVAAVAETAAVDAEAVDADVETGAAVADTAAAAVDCVAADDLSVGGSAAAVAAAGSDSAVAVWHCRPLMAGRVQWVQAPGWASDQGPAGSTGRERREVRH